MLCMSAMLFEVTGGRVPLLPLEKLECKSVCYKKGVSHSCSRRQLAFVRFVQCDLG